MRIALLDPEGREIALHLRGEETARETETILDLTETEQCFELEQVPTRPVVSLFRDFSAPIQLQAGYSDDELGFFWPTTRIPSIAGTLASSLRFA